MADVQRVQSDKRCRRYFSVSCILFCCLVGILNARPKKDNERFQFGLFSRFAPFLHLHDQGSHKQTYGGFVSYKIARKICLELQMDRHGPYKGAGVCFESGRPCIVESLQKRDWSTNFAVAYHLRDIGAVLSPYIGLGVGDYYLQDSKMHISTARDNESERNIDFEMRRYFKRPGLFGTMGVRFRTVQRAVFFLQAKCSVLFERDNIFIVGKTSSFSDWLNISTGIRLKLN